MQERAVPQGKDEAAFEDDEGAVGDDLSYAIFLLFGITVLWPFNTIISVPAYFNLLYPERNLEFLLPVLMNIPSFLILLAMVHFARSVSFSFRIYASLVLTSALLASVPLINQLDTQHTLLPFVLLIVLTLFLGFIVAILQSSIFGLAGTLPALYTQAVMSGNGFAGLGVSLMRMGTKLMFSSDLEGQKKSALLFFLLSSFMCATCMVAFFTFTRSSFGQYHLAKHSASLPSCRSHNERDGLQIVFRDYDSEFTSLIGQDLVNQDVESSSPVDNIVVLKKIWSNGLVAFGTFFVTLLIFPGLISELKSTIGLDQSWFTLILITLFNLFDTVGRSLPRWFRFFSSASLWVPCLLRVALYPAFVLLNSHSIFGGDYLTFFLVLLLALTNGYIGSLAMMFGPERVASHEQENAGYIMNIFLMLGINSALVTATLLVET